jgi:vancomycin resistance protein VanJ
VKRIAHRLVLLAGVALGLAWIIGWIGKDRSPLTMWFYFIPAPVAAAGVGTALVLAARDAWAPARFLLKAALALALLKIGFVDFAWNRRPDSMPDDAIRVVHWNTERGSKGVKSQFVSLAAEHPDICVYSESPRKGDVRGMSRLQLGLEHVVDADGMTVMSRYPCSAANTIKLTNARGWWTRIETPGRPIDLVVVDFISHPLLDRFVPVAELCAWLDRRGQDVPVLLLGDFNTPRDSLSFEPLRRRLRHGYEVAGSGWPYTWPVPLPCYAIDHTWFSAGMEVLDYRLHTTTLSDHRRQIADVVMAAPRVASD